MARSAGHGLAGAARAHAVPVRSAAARCCWSPATGWWCSTIKSLNQTSNIPLGRTPLGILLADHVHLVRRRDGDRHAAPARPDPGDPGAHRIAGDGTLTLVFADNPLTLRQWTVLDAQRQETRVTLYNVQTRRQFRPEAVRVHRPDAFLQPARAG